jgi:hypothetical protein
MDRGAGVGVDLEALTGFARSVGTHADDLASALPVITEALIRTGASFGLSGQPRPSANAREATLTYAEHVGFFARYETLTDSVRHLMSDVYAGLAALASAAEVVAITYAGTDQINAAAVRRVADALQTGGLVGAMDVPLSGSADVSTAAVDAAFAPTTHDQLRTPLTSPAGRPAAGTGTSAVASPATPAADAGRVDAEFHRQVRQAEQHPQTGMPMREGGYTVGKGPYRIQVPRDAVPDSRLGDPTHLPRG